MQKPVHCSLYIHIVAYLVAAANKDMLVRRCDVEDLCITSYEIGPRPLYPVLVRIFKPLFAVPFDKSGIKLDFFIIRTGI